MRPYIYIYIYIYRYICIYAHEIYRVVYTCFFLPFSLSLSMYIYIYIYIVVTTIAIHYFERTRMLRQINLVRNVFWRRQANEEMNFPHSPIRDECKMNTRRGKGTNRGNIIICLMGGLIGNQSEMCTGERKSEPRH